MAAKFEEILNLQNCILSKMLTELNIYEAEKVIRDAGYIVTKDFWILIPRGTELSEDVSEAAYYLQIEWDYRFMWT